MGFSFKPKKLFKKAKRVVKKTYDSVRRNPLDAIATVANPIGLGSVAAGVNTVSALSGEEEVAEELDVGPSEAELAQQRDDLIDKERRRQRQSKGRASTILSDGTTGGSISSNTLLG